MYNTKGKTQKAYSKNKPTKNIIPKNCVAIFPIELVSGRTQISNQGILPPTKYYDKGSFLYYQEVFDGRSALKIQWEDSIYLTKPEGKNYYLAQPQIGLWYYGKPISMSEEALEISDNESFEDFIGLKASQTITLYFEYSPTDRQATKESIEQFFRFKLVDNDIYNLYQIPEICEQKLMYIQSHNEIYDDLTGKSKGCQITFASLGDKIQKSGKAIEQYCSWNAPGEFAVIPKIVKTYDEEYNETRNVVYDNAAYVAPKPVRYLQVEQQGPALTSTIYALGRRQEWDEEQQCWRIGPSKILLPCDFITTQPNPLNRTSTPSKNFFFFHDEQVSFITSAGFWKMITDSAQQPLEKMRNGGLITLGSSSTWKDQKTGEHKSNEIQAGGTWFDYYSKAWYPTAYLGADTETERKQPYFDTNGCIYCEDEMAYKITDTMVDIMCKNVFIFNQQPIIPLSMSATRPYYLRDIPLIGSIANFFKLGDFHLNQNTTNRKASHLAFFGDASLMGLCANTYQGMSDKAHPWSDGTVAFPINFFGNNDTQWNKFGVNACNTTLCMELSDRINLTTHNETKTWDTIYLAQSKYEDGTYIFDDHSSLLANSSIKVSKPAVSVGYIIDAVIVQSIFEGKIKISCYGENESEFIYPLWTATILSNAAWEGGAMRDWTNFFPLSNWEERFCVQEDKFTWPDEPHKDITSVPTWNVKAETNVNIAKDSTSWYQDAIEGLQIVDYDTQVKNEHYAYCFRNKELTIDNPTIAYSDLGDQSITSWETLIAKYKYVELDIDGSNFNINGTNYNENIIFNKKKIKFPLEKLATNQTMSLVLMKSKENTPYIIPSAIGPLQEKTLKDDQIWYSKLLNQNQARYGINIEVEFRCKIQDTGTGMKFICDDNTLISSKIWADKDLGNKIKSTQGPYTESGPGIKWGIKVNSIKFTN